MSKSRLLVSVFNPEEVRAAVAGGVDIIDCEDPQADVGMFEPRVITNVAYAVRQARSNRLIPTSANIGFNLQQFERAHASRSTPRSQLEVEAKAAQEALGVAAAMDVGDSRPNIVKFGVDGMPQHLVTSLVAAIKSAVRNSRSYQNHQVIGALLAIDAQEWETRKKDDRTIKPLLRIGQFYFADSGSIDLRKYFTDDEIVRILGYAPERTCVELIEPFSPKELGMPEDLKERLREYVDLIAAGGADGAMIDTPLQAKLSRICLVDDPNNASDDGGGKKPPRHGVFSYSLLEFFCDYCAYKGLESWVAGSIQPYHAQKLGKINSLDTVLCRGSASAVVQNPSGGSGGDERSLRRISEERVRAMADAVAGIHYEPEDKLP